MTRPRILFVSHYAGRTGAPIGLLAFMQWLRVNTSYAIGTILCTPGPLEASFRELGPVLTLGNSILGRSRLGRRLRRALPTRLHGDVGALRRMFKSGAYDVIYSNTMMNGEMLEALAPFEVPVITHAHELEYWISRTGARNLQRVLDCTTMFIAASQAVKDNLIQNHGVSGERITVVYEHIRELPPVPSAAEKATARSEIGIAQGAFVVGGCGAEYWRKGRDLIPQLLLALRREDPGTDFHFLWVGRPGTPEEEAMLRHDLRCAGVDNRFHQTGEVSNPFAYYPAMDVFALLSRDDPYPLACLEVAAMSKPVVCFAGAGGMPEFVGEECGFVSPYLDINSMAAAIASLAHDHTGSAKRGQRARAKVADENTLDTTAPQLQAIVDACAFH